MEKAFAELYNALLLNRRKCPWAKEQSLAGHAKQLASEANELLEAVENNDIENMKEELGDVFWDALFFAIIAEEKGYFCLNDSLKEALAKLKRRKSWVFQGIKIKGKEEAVRLWNEAKAKEKQSKGKK